MGSSPPISSKNQAHDVKSRSAPRSISSSDWGLGSWESAVPAFVAPARGFTCSATQDSMCSGVATASPYASRTAHGRRNSARRRAHRFRAALRRESRSRPAAVSATSGRFHRACDSCSSTATVPLHGRSSTRSARRSRRLPLRDDARGRTRSSRPGRRALPRGRARRARAPSRRIGDGDRTSRHR